MKVELTEEKTEFNIHFIAETVDEAATLVRLGMNHTERLKLCETDAFSDGGIATWVSIGNKARRSATIPKRP